jgi:LacI family transcriptional regulator
MASMTKRPTQNDVARLAGVSRATVSYVLNGQTDGRVPISDETFQRVTRAIEQLGYEPDARAQALRSGSTHTIGVIIPDLSNPHFCEYATGVEMAARAAGYHILLSSIALNVEYALSVFKDLATRRIDGLILATAFILNSPEAQKTLQLLRERQLPIVELSDQYDVDCIASDYREATRDTMAYLLGLGHRRIGFIYGTHGAPEVGDDRLEPFRDSLRAAGVFDPTLIANCGPTIEDGYQAALTLLQRPDRPTAILAINDLLAMGVLRATVDLNLHVPDDLSLAGFDDIPLAHYLTPRLTSVSKNALQIGQDAFRMLLARIQDPGLPRQRLVAQTRLIIRESTGPVPGTASH